MELSETIVALCQRHAETHREYPWLSESMRWNELVFCVLLRCGSASAPRTRGAIAVLDQLSLLTPISLERLDADAPEGVTFSYVLHRAGFSTNDAARAMRVLATMAHTVNAKYRGKLQKLIREHAERLRESLVADFASGQFDPAQLQEAIGHWLQNGFGLPVSLRSEAVSAFCDEAGCTLDALIEAADDLDLNIGFVDDMIASERASAEQNV